MVAVNVEAEPGSDNENSREADLITRGAFADVVEVLREGAAVDKDEAEEIIRLASTTPSESNVKVVIIHEVHLMRDSAAARLLKTIEEPSEKVIFILLADTGARVDGTKNRKQQNRLQLSLS
jgi:DNA polymerase III gamma/tau subunit